MDYRSRHPRLRTTPLPELPHEWPLRWWQPEIRQQPAARTGADPERRATDEATKRAEALQRQINDRGRR